MILETTAAFEPAPIPQATSTKGVTDRHSRIACKGSARGAGEPL